MISLVSIFTFDLLTVMHICPGSERSAENQKSVDVVWGSASEGLRGLSPLVRTPCAGSGPDAHWGPACGSDT